MESDIRQRRRFLGRLASVVGGLLAVPVLGGPAQAGHNTHRRRGFRGFGGPLGRGFGYPGGYGYSRGYGYGYGRPYGRISTHRRFYGYPGRGYYGGYGGYGVPAPIYGGGYYAPVPPPMVVPRGLFMPMLRNDAPIDPLALLEA